MPERDLKASLERVNAALAKTDRVVRFEDTPNLDRQLARLDHLSGVEFISAAGQVAQKRLQILERLTRVAKPKLESQKASLVGLQQKEGKEPEKQLPKIIIDYENQRALIADRKIQFYREGNWEIFLYLAQRAKQEVISSSLDDFLQKQQLRSTVGQAVANLRKKIEVDWQKPDILVTLRRKGHFAIYCLRAEVEFTDQGQEATLTGLQQEEEKARPPKETEREIPQAIIFEKDRRLEIGDDWIIEFSDSPEDQVDFAVLMALAKNVPEELNLEQVSQIAKSAGSRESSPGTSSIARFMLDFKDAPQKAQILRKTGWGLGQKYSLDAHFTFLERTRRKLEGKKLDITKRPKEFPKADETRMAALLKIINLPETTVEEIVKVLGPSKRTGRELTKPQAKWALYHLINILYVRQTASTLTERESEVWKTIKEVIQEEQDRIALDKIRERLDAWFRKSTTLTLEEKTQTEAIEATQVDKFNQRETAVLANLFLLRDGVKIIQSDKELFTFILPEFYKDICKELVKRARHFPRMSQDQLDKVRSDIISKVTSMLEGGNLEDIDKQEEPVRELLTWIYANLQDEFRGHILAFLSKNPISRTSAYRGVVETSERVWYLPNGDGNGHTEEQRLPYQTPTISLGDVANHSLVIGSTQEVGKQAGAFGLKITAPPSRLEERKAQLERKTNEARIKISTILDEIAERQIIKPINAAQLTRFFPKVKARDIDIAEEKGLIRPQKGRDHHPAFEVDEIAFLIYYVDSHNSFNSRQVKELRRIITQEVEKRKDKTDRGNNP